PRPAMASVEGSGVSRTVTVAMALMLPEFLAVGGPGGAKLPTVTVKTRSPMVTDCVSGLVSVFRMIGVLAERVPLNLPEKTMLAVLEPLTEGSLMVRVRV